MEEFEIHHRPLDLIRQIALRIDCLSILELPMLILELLL